MKGERPSRTAHLVALGRAMSNEGMSNVPGFSDPTARVFLSDRGRKSLDKTVAALRAGKTGWSVLGARSMANMMALRTSAIDDAVRNAIKDGAKQLVILGAGYDGRAWRMPELANVRVFEVDHPATQNDKRAHVAQLATSADVTFVAVDFKRDSLEGALNRAGHDARQTTCWIWEGVVMYLTLDTVRTTLGMIARMSAPDSTLILNYHTPYRRQFLGRVMLRLIGEPHISKWEPSEMAEDLRKAGFEVRQDTNMIDWNNAFAGGKANVERAVYMRLVVAKRVG